MSATRESVGICDTGRHFARNSAARAGLGFHEHRIQTRYFPERSHWTTRPFAVSHWATGCKDTTADTGTVASGAGHMCIFRARWAQAPRLKRWRMRCRSAWCPAQRCSGTTARSTTFAVSEKRCATHKDWTGNWSALAREAPAWKSKFEAEKHLCIVFLT